jgi:type I restriction enzyme S subunit
MSSEWNTVPLGDVASFKTGKLDSNAAEQGGKYPFFTCSPNTLAINSFAFDAEAVILAGNNANGVFSCKHYSGKFNAYQRTYVIEPLSKSIASCRYLFFVISHQVNHLKELSVGSATKFLTKTILNNLPVALPRLEEQERIAELLGALDDRITLLRETNATLEAIAQALFKSWFVDFDPVRAKQEGRAPEGMSDATAALFPDGFEESELGLVPKGWRVAKFGDFVSRLSVGKKFDQKSARTEGAVPILDQGKSGVIGFHNEIPGVIANLDDPVVVFANHTCYMRLISFPFSAIQNVLPFKGKEVDTIWAFYATKDRVKFSEYKGHWPDFAIEKAVLPDCEVTKSFRKAVDPLVRRVRLNEMKTETLAALRDTLLPRLISGQLRLPEAAALIEEAT